MSNAVPFVYRLVLQWPETRRAANGVVLVIAGDKSAALARGHQFALERAQKSPGAVVASEWLEPMIPFIVSAAAKQSAPDWAALASGEKGNLHCCIAGPIATRQSSGDPRDFGLQVHGLVAAGDIDEAERLWNDFLTHEFIGMSALEISEELPAIVVATTGELPAQAAS